MPEGALADLQAAAMLQEPGCIRYAFAQDLLDRTLIHISEAWRDKAALDAQHSASRISSSGSDVSNER
jgi:quinol monooxygenase YgiN